MMEFLKRFFGAATGSEAHESALADEVRKVFSRYLTDLWNHLLTYNDPKDLKITLEGFGSLGSDVRAWIWKDQMKPTHLDMLNFAEALTQVLEDGNKPDLSEVYSLL